MRRLNGELGAASGYPPLPERIQNAFYVVASGKVERCRSVGIYANIRDKPTESNQILVGAWRHIMDTPEASVILHPRAVVCGFPTETEVACYVGALGYPLEAIPDLRQHLDIML